MSWTEELEATVVRLWAEGYSGGQIETKIDGIKSRSAILAKLDRKCLLGRTLGKKRSFQQPKKMPVAQAEPIKSRWMPGVPMEATPLPAEPADARPTHELVQLLDLEPWHCRWPIGEPMRGFCGAKRGPIGSYCTQHHTASVQPPLGRSPQSEAGGSRQDQINRRRVA